MLYLNVFLSSELFKFCLKCSLFVNMLPVKADISNAYQVTFLPGVFLAPE